MPPEVGWDRESRAMEFDDAYSRTILKSMLKLQDIRKNVVLAGIDPSAPVGVAATEAVGDNALTIVYETASGSILVPQRSIRYLTMTPISNAQAATLMELQKAIEQAEGQYFRLIILTGPPGSGKTSILRWLAERNGCEIVNVNLELSKRMLELPRVHRPRVAEKVLKNLIAESTKQVLVLDNIEILFDTALQLEPLRLLQISSRNRTLVVSWSGNYQHSTLTYAQPGHPEFAQFKQVEGIVITVGPNGADKGVSAQ